MKKTLIAAIVGGLLIFICQTLSWTILFLHEPSQAYTPKEDSILAVLNTTLEKDGGYLVPGMPKGTSMEEMQKKGEKNLHKPWATIQYHKDFKTDMNQMYKNMLYGFLSNILMVGLLCWILSKMGKTGFGTTFLATLFVGIIVFINAPFTNHIWYELFDIKAYLIDAVLGWGVCGIWLGWWLNRK